MRDSAITEEIDLVSTAERTIVDLAGRGLAPLMALGRYKYLHAHEPRDEDKHRGLLVLALPLKGRFGFVVDGRTVHVRPGEVVRIPPGTRYRTGVTTEPRGELMWLILQCRTDSVEMAGDELHRAIRLLSNSDDRLTWYTSTDPRQCADRLFGLAAQPRDWIADGLLRYALIEALLSITRAFHDGGAGVSDHRHQAIGRCLAWLEEHIADPCDVGDLEAVSGLATSWFYQAFRAETGTSPKDYLLRRRIDHARQWLERDPDVTVAQIAHALGFSSSQYFATVFRRYEGCSPSQVRTSGERS